MAFPIDQLAPDIMAPLFHPVYNPAQPFATAPTKKRKYYLCRDHRGAESLKRVDPSDGDAFRDLMKQYTSVENVPK